MPYKISPSLKELLATLNCNEEFFQEFAAVEEFSKEELEDLEYMQDRIKDNLSWLEYENSKIERKLMQNNTETDISLNCILPAVKYTIDNWINLKNQNLLNQEEKESILKKLTEIQSIIHNNF